MKLPVESYSGDPYDDCCSGCFTLIPKYDTSWSATGPLIERYHFSLSYILTDCTYCVYAWQAYDAGPVSEREWGYGDTPLLAICNLILKLAKEGKIHEG